MNEIRPGQTLFKSWFILIIIVSLVWLKMLNWSKKSPFRFAHRGKAPYATPALTAKGGTAPFETRAGKRKSPFRCRNELLRQASLLESEVIQGQGFPRLGVGHIFGGLHGQTPRVGDFLAGQTLLDQEILL